MKIGIYQINPIIGDFKYNSSLIRGAVDDAVKEGCSLAVFPELSLMGYPPKDLLEKPAFVEDNLECLETLARSISNVHVLCGYVDRSPKKRGRRLVNAVALIKEGRIVGRGGKRLLPTYDVFDEIRYFEPAEESLLFELEGRRIGVTICEDIWNFADYEEVPAYEVDPVSELRARGMDVLINVSASPYTLGKRRLRSRMLEKISSVYRIPAIYCNQVGGNDELLFDGSSMVLDRRGRMILRAKSFESDRLIWNMDLPHREIRRPWSEKEEETVLKGLAMGTRDYVHKCGFRKVIVGLSGGLDSSLVAVIATNALGPENVTGVSMPSRYTSEMSMVDAAALAANLGIDFYEIPINEIFEDYLSGLAPVFAGREEDETEENIQARIRGDLLMALANKFNALVLSTGNKSEIAIGYCTLYGDMSGALAVISDVPKTMCYRLSAFINRRGEIIPGRVLRRPPSAELRPDQTDQDSLPPYEVLDDIIEASVVRHLGFAEIVARGHDPAVVRDILGRITSSEYKRRQAPPGLKITTKAFGYGRRYPVARGGRPY